MAISPTAEGFRAAFRRPSLTLAEIAWRWTTGATAAALFFFGLFEYLDTLPITSGELLFLRTRQPYLVAEAIAHIFRGTLSRAAAASILAALLMIVLWIVAGSVGRMATVRGLLDYFSKDVVSAARTEAVADRDLASNDSTNKVSPATESSPLPALIRINFLRAAVTLAAVFGFIGAAILAGFASPDADPEPWLAFFLFVPLAGFICLAWSSLNWLLSLAGMFAVRDRTDTVGAISTAATFCRERIGAVFAVGAWTGLAHLVAFVGATTVISIPLGLTGALPWRLTFLIVVLMTLAYFALADWLYMARLAGYVCIAEMPEKLLAPLPPPPQPYHPPPVSPSEPPVQTTIDRDEPILSDLPNLAMET